MAEQDTDQQHTAEGQEEETQSTMDHDVSPSYYKQERDPDEKRQLSEDSASSSTSTNRETKNDNGEDTVQPVKKGKEEETQSTRDHDVSLSNCKEEATDHNEKHKLSGDGYSADERMAPPDDDTPLNVTENRTPLQGDVGSRGDHNRQTPRNEQRTTAAEESRERHTGEKKASETTTPPTLGDGKEDQAAGPQEESPDTNTTNTEAADDDGSGREEVLTHKEEKDVQENRAATQEEVETIGATTQETADVPVVNGNLGGCRIYLIAGILLFFAILGQHLLQPESPPQKDDVQQIDIFLRQLEKVKTHFPNQRAELWSRSKIHLLRHLQTAQPTEPVSLILTAGHRAERTLHCLAQSLASAFSTSLNASVLHIDGASKASQDSDQVKLDIDSKLQGAFEGDKPVAVIDRFEELPPGSTLIFYRYCDHENAAYKKTCLIFTVLLGEEEEIPAETRLSTVEEMVDDHLQKKFLSDGRPVSFDRMDLDKYGGLWSRISHLILPVAAEKRIEREGC